MYKLFFIHFAFLPFFFVLSIKKAQCALRYEKEMAHTRKEVETEEEKKCNKSSHTHTHRNEEVLTPLLPLLQVNTHACTHTQRY